MAERQGLSGCAISAITGAVLLLIATLVGCGLLAIFVGGVDVRPLTVEVQTEPATPPQPAPSEQR